jgi:hypothetical protein
MAAQTRNPIHKRQLEEMAQAWEMLAKERAKQISKRKAYDPSRSACSAIARHVRAISNTTLLAGSKDSRLATRWYSSALARYSSALVQRANGPRG